MKSRQELEREIESLNFQLNSVKTKLKTEIEGKQAEIALLESEEKYRILFENMIEVAHFWRLVRNREGQIETWRLVDANPAALKIWNKTLEDIVGKTADEIYPGSTAHYFEVVQKIMTEEAPSSFEEYYPPPLDQHFHFTSVPFGEYFITTGADITSIRKSEEALRASEQRMRMQMERMPIGCIIYDERNCFRQLNPSAERIFGYSESELRGKHGDVIVPESARPHVYEIRRRLAEGDLTAHGVNENVTKDGRTIICQWTNTPLLDAKGRFAGSLAMVQDVTERKQTEAALIDSERRFRTLIEYAPVAIGIGRDGKHLYANSAYLKMFGLKHVDEIVGRPIANQWAPEWRPTINERIYHRHLGIPAPSDYEAVGQRPDGTRFPANIVATGMHLPDGPATMAFITDLSERKRTEEALLQAKTALEKTVQERTAELSRQASQLRALAGELTLAEQRERQQLAHVLHDGLQQILVGAKYRLNSASRSQDIRSELDQVSELIDDAIETSRSLTAELSPTVLLQGDLVSALEWLAHWMQDKYDLNVSLTARHKIEFLMQDVILLLFQAVRELLFNVVKHAGVKSARVKVNQLHERILITVEDEGIGFEPRRLRSKGGQAGGIGLFSISERLSNMGGRLRIESVPGRGSRFKLSIPYSPAGAITDQASADLKKQVSVAIPSHLKAEPPGEKQTRIILVDDHLVMRQGLAGLLRLEPDFEIIGEASDGEAAIDIIGELTPDVVLMDVSMPGMDGIEATRIIHQKYPQVQVIGLSMFDAKEIGSAMLEAGAVDYIAKSGPSETLIEAIRACARV